MKKEKAINEIAKKFAIKAHRDRNLRYGEDLPYSYHLSSAAEIAENYKWMISEEEFPEVLAGVWCHDVIEDTGKTYNDVKRETNEVVAEYAYALTNEKGRTRKERANDKYYKGIRSYKHATFIKLCDRIANVKYSLSVKNRMFDMYKSEQEDFTSHLYDGRYDAMWLLLKMMLNGDVTLT